MKATKHFLIFLVCLGCVGVMRIAWAGHFELDRRSVIAEATKRRSREIEDGWLSQTYTRFSAVDTMSALAKKTPLSSLPLSEAQRTKLEPRLLEILTYFEHPNPDEYYRLKTDRLHWTFRPGAPASGFLARSGPLVWPAYKLFSPGEATYAVMSLDIPDWLALWTIIIVTALELYLGIVLVCKIDLRYGLSVATCLMLAFTSFLWYLSTKAHPPACGCMGLTWAFTSGKDAAVLGIARNCAILWLLKMSYDYYCAGDRGQRPRAVDGPEIAQAGELGAPPATA